LAQTGGLVLMRATPSSFLPFVAPKAECKSALHCRRRISLAQEVLSWLVLSDKKGPLGRRARR
jgi:hypothetical protein